MKPNRIMTVTNGIMRLIDDYIDGLKVNDHYDTTMEFPIKIETTEIITDFVTDITISPMYNLKEDRFVALLARVKVFPPDNRDNCIISKRVSVPMGEKVFYNLKDKLKTALIKELESFAKKKGVISKTVDK